MRSRHSFSRRCRALAALWVLVATGSFSGTASAQVDAQNARPFVRALERAPFVENLGQWPAEALFRASTGGVCAWITDDGFWVDARRLVAVPGPRQTPAPVGAGAAGAVGTALRFTFIDAAPAATSGEGHVGHPRHYLLGDDSERWVRGARGHAAVRCAGLYPGVDLLLRTGEGGRFEYDLELGPVADLSAVRVRVEGADGLDVDADGALVVRTPHGDLRQSPPLAYTLEGERVDCSFVLLDAATYGFTAPPVAEAFVIDPGLEWSTLLGDDDHDQALGLELLPGGDVIACGATYSFAFPTTAGAYSTSAGGLGDGFVTRLSADGSAAVFSTYLGGTAGDFVRSARVDSQGRVLVAGETQSGDFPTTAGAFDATWDALSDVFVAQLDSSGSQLLWSTLLGGDQWDRAGELAVRSDDLPVVVGTTGSASFPTTVGAYDRSYNGGSFGGDVFVACVAQGGGSLVFSTFLGGTRDDAGICVDLLDTDAVVIGGSTASSNFPVTSGAFDLALAQQGGFGLDGFVARLNPTGAQLVFSTYLGGLGGESVQDVAAAASGEVLAGGWTESSDFPTTQGAFQTTQPGFVDGFLLRLTANGGALAWSTYVGGTDEDRVEAVALGRQDTAICALSTWSPDMPTTAGCYDAQIGTPGPVTGRDVFLTELSPDGATQRYGTYIGGSDDDEVQDLVVDRTQDSDACVLCGSTRSWQYPLTAGAFDTIYDNSFIPDGVVTRIDFSLHPIPFGTGKVTSMNVTPIVYNTGFPSVTGSGFWLGFVGGIAGQMGFAFYGPTTVTAPFLGGTRYVGDPATRIGPFTLGFLGDALIPIDMDRSLIGQTLYYQVWFRDPNDPYGAGLSNALKVVYYR